MTHLARLLPRNAALPPVARLAVRWSWRCEAAGVSGFGLGDGSVCPFHTLLPSQIFANALFGTAQGAGKGNFGQIVKIQTGNQILVRGSDRLLRLDDFQVVGDPGRETIAGLR